MQDKFEEVFGANVGVPATNATRWNSVLHQVKGILSKGMTELNSVSREADHSELVFSQKEWEQLTELDVVLTPFKEYTDILQGDEVSTFVSICEGTPPFKKLVLLSL